MWYDCFYLSLFISEVTKPTMRKTSITTKISNFIHYAKQIENKYLLSIVDNESFFNFKNFCRCAIPIFLFALLPCKETGLQFTAVFYVSTCVAYGLLSLANDVDFFARLRNKSLFLYFMFVTILPAL
jgi:hypothetical protein